MTRVGTRIGDEGIVVRRDTTPYGLQRMCIQLDGKYPDLETWSSLIPNPTIWRHRYTERVTDVACHCFLWIYWKE